MTWFRVDDTFPHHRKLEKLRKICETDAVFTAAITVWTLMGADCSLRSPGGSFSEDRLHRVVPISPGLASKVCIKLVEAELFDPSEEEHQFHDFEVYNGTEDEAKEKQVKREALSAARRSAGSKGGSSRAAKAQANGKQLLEAKPKQTLQATVAQPVQAVLDPPSQALLARVPAGAGSGRDTSETPEGDARGTDLDAWAVVEALAEHSRPTPQEAPRIQLTILGTSEKAYQDVLAQFAAQGWKLGDFIAWAKLAARGEDDWWSGEYSTLTVFGRCTIDPETRAPTVPATGLLRCLEEARKRTSRRQSPPPRMFRPPAPTGMPITSAALTATLRNLPKPPPGDDVA